MGSTMHTRALLAIVALVASAPNTNASQVVVSQCTDSCSSLLKQHAQHNETFPQFCDALCQKSLAIDSDCLSSLLVWAKDPDKGSKALSASENPIEFASLFVSML